MFKKRVFVSYDFDHDRCLKEFVIGQSRLPDSPFDVIDFSLKEAAPMKTWEDKARAAIKRAEIVIIMLGAETWRASGVLKEIKIAKEEGKRLVQVIGYSNKTCKAIPGAGMLYRWNWPNMKNILGQ